MNLPNKLTVLRMILIVPFVVFLLLGRGEGWMKWAALAVFCAASLTDMLDGKIARKYNLITDFGKFMDPLADKLLVCSALICLVDLGRLPSWICIWWGKTKTVSQMAMVILMICNFDIPWVQMLTTVIMYIACALTVISLVDYIAKNKQVLASQK